MSLPSGIAWDAVQRVLHAWVVAGSDLPDQKVYWGEQDAPRPKAPAITMRLANDAENSKAWVDYYNNPLTFSAKTVTAVDTAANSVTSVAHGMLTGDGPVQLVGTLPAPLQANTDYWVVAPSADHLQFCSTYVSTGGGQGSTNPITVIDLTTAPGTFTINATASTVRAGQELVAIARSLERVTLELHCHSLDGIGLAAAKAILQRVRARRVLPSQQARLRAANMGILFVERVRAVQGVRDAVKFEPRAYLDIQLSIPSEIAEPVTIIRRTAISNPALGISQFVDTGDL